MMSNILGSFVFQDSIKSIPNRKLSIDSVLLENI